MSHFYGVVNGQAKTEATRRGSKNSGLTVTAASWNGAVEVQLYVDADGNDAFRVVQRTWQGAGVSQVIAEGKVGVAV